MNLCNLTGKYFCEGISDEAQSHAIGDAIGQGHACKGQKCRECFIPLIPVYPGKVRDHEATNNDKHWSGNWIERPPDLRGIAPSDHFSYGRKEQGQHKKRIATTTAVRPVRPPSATPVELSM